VDLEQARSVLQQICTKITPTFNAVLFDKLELGEMLYSEREIYRQRIFVTIATKAFTMDHIALIGNNTAIYFKQLI